MARRSRTPAGRPLLCHAASRCQWCGTGGGSRRSAPSHHPCASPGGAARGGMATMTPGEAPALGGGLWAVACMLLPAGSGALHCHPTPAHASHLPSPPRPTPQPSVPGPGRCAPPSLTRMTGTPIPAAGTPQWRRVVMMSLASAYLLRYAEAAFHRLLKGKGEGADPSITAGDWNGHFRSLLGYTHVAAAGRPAPAAAAGAAQAAGAVAGRAHASLLSCDNATCPVYTSAALIPSFPPFPPQTPHNCFSPPHSQLIC